MMLTILCVTKAEAHAWPFLRLMENVAHVLDADFVVAADGQSAADALLASSIEARFCMVRSTGFIESALDEAIVCCQDGYILRLDDDEACSQEMIDWLILKGYEAADHWKFARRHLWQTSQQYIVTPPLWPDHQTRLSIKEKSGGRYTIHAGSPYGGGEYAPDGVDIEHHKFLVKSREEREMIANQWHGGSMRAFSVPEDAMSLIEVVPC